MALIPGMEAYRVEFACSPCICVGSLLVFGHSSTVHMLAKVNWKLSIVLGVCVRYPANLYESDLGSKQVVKMDGSMFKWFVFYCTNKCPEMLHGLVNVFFVKPDPRQLVLCSNAPRISSILTCIHSHISPTPQLVGCILYAIYFLFV